MVGSLFFDLLPCVPLFFYAVFLAVLHRRNRPTVLEGHTDMLLLALGVSGFVMKTVGQAVIPLGALSFYGIFAWVLLFLLYLNVVFAFSVAFSRKIMVYNLGPSDLRSIPLLEVPGWKTEEKGVSETDTGSKPSGAVPCDEPPKIVAGSEKRIATPLRRLGKSLLFPERGLDLSVEYSAWSRCAVLRYPSARVDSEDWAERRKEVRAYFSDKEQTKKTLCSFLASVAACGLAGYIIGYVITMIRDFQVV